MEENLSFSHYSVLLRECVDGLNLQENGTYVDATAGGGGHSRAILQALPAGARLFSLDKDPDALRVLRERLGAFPASTVVETDFKDMASALRAYGVTRVNGILADLGVSSYQLDTPERGFSYQSDAPLDMRMSKEGFSAYDLLNTWSESEIARILWEYGEEKFARSIARQIGRAREKGPVQTTFQLNELIKSGIPAAKRREGGNPCKRSYQAIRIAVNGELSALKTLLSTGFSLLSPGGRMAIITFHSLEDRMVKNAFAGYCQGCTCPKDFPVCVCHKTPHARLVTRKPVLPSEEELQENHRSHSAKLRILEKIQDFESES